MAPSTAKVLSAHACHVTAAQTPDAASAEATEMASAKAAAHVASTKTAAHVTSATTTMSTAAAATAGLGISGKKAAGKHGACQNHHHSSYHDISPFGMGGTFRHRISSDVGVCQRQTPTSRWTGDGNACLSSLLNSGSTIGVQYPARSKVSVRRINTWTLRLWSAPEERDRPARDHIQRVG
jgi:hypothetical protein